MSKNDMHPYLNLPPISFWRTGVADLHYSEINGLWNPKFNITLQDCVVTYGSCFAQHIGNALKARGFNWGDFEIAPTQLSKKNKIKYSYGIFSSRTQNIYTSSFLLQLLKAVTSTEDVLGDEVWLKDGRFYDPFRVTVEPLGFLSCAELFASRKKCLLAFLESIQSANIFIFTLGLTESWINSLNGLEYQTCPGTVAGSYSKDIHLFKKLSYDDVNLSMIEAIKLMRSINPNLKFLLTVSPVPLTATYSVNHVLLATMESKSILRSVCSNLIDLDYVDYFPSYEIVNSPPFKSSFYSPNMRQVSKFGVDFIMNYFFMSINEKYPNIKFKVQDLLGTKSSDDIVCDEVLLDAFNLKIEGQ